MSRVEAAASVGGGKKAVFVWLRSRGSGKGSGVIRNWCLGLENLAHV